MSFAGESRPERIGNALVVMMELWRAECSRSADGLIRNLGPDSKEVAAVAMLDEFLASEITRTLHKIVDIRLCLRK